MYYLFENNRIAEIENENKDMFNDEVFDKLIEQRNGKIKKKSENIYDLIEIGDLVKIYSTFFRKIDSLGLQKMHSLVGIEGDFFPENEISEIYKPDQNGNFIKVWGKEGGEENEK